VSRGVDDGSSPYKEDGSQSKNRKNESNDTPVSTTFSNNAYTPPSRTLVSGLFSISLS
jgi:hypothetical protein